MSTSNFAVEFIEKRAEEYLRDHASTENDTGATVWHYGDAGRDYHNDLVELADDLRAAIAAQSATRTPVGAGDGNTYVVNGVPAKGKPSAAQSAGTVGDDLAWHKESLNRHAAKLDAVWDGIREAVAKYTGKPCEGEPFDRLHELLARLAGGEVDSAPQADPVAWIDPLSVPNLKSGASTKEWMWAKPEAGNVGVYLAAPSQAVAQEGSAPQAHEDRLALIRNSGDQQLIADVAAGRISIKAAVEKVGSLASLPDVAMPEPWQDRTSLYETDAFSKIERMEAEIADWRALATQPAEGSAQVAKADEHALHTKHDAQIIADLEAMAADRNNGFWPQALAVGALRIIRTARATTERAAAPERSDTPAGLGLYECIGKGGKYELLGTAKAAGVYKGTEDVKVYRDTDGGQLYFRRLFDFDQRMARIDLATPSAAEGATQAGELPDDWKAAIDEVARATQKFPTWPTDPLHAVSVLGEEFGELTKAVLQTTYEPHKVQEGELRTEAIQTAAMALRFLASLDRYEFTRCPQHEQHIARIDADKQGAQNGGSDGEA